MRGLWLKPDHVPRPGVKGMPGRLMINPVVLLKQPLLK